MMTGLQSASIGLLLAGEDEDFHQCFICTAFSSLGHSVRRVSKGTDRFNKTGLDLH